MYNNYFNIYNKIEHFFKYNNKYFNLIPNNNHCFIFKKMIYYI